MAAIRTWLGSVLLLAGCASIDNLMQPDGSYKIYTYGNCLLETEDTAAASVQRASQLCTGGYAVKSTISGEDWCHPYTQLIVKCN